MKISKVLIAVAIITTTGFLSCKPKDGDIKAAIETKLNSMPGMAGATADVKDGVATLSGQCKDATCKAECEASAQGVKGVKSVINNLNIAAPPPPPPTAEPVAIATDDALEKGVTDATKDFASVKADVNDGVVTLTGNIRKADLQKLMMTLNSLKPKKIENKLTVK